MSRKTIAQRSGGLARCTHPEPVPGCAACDLFKRFPHRFRPQPGEVRTPLLDAVVEAMGTPPAEPTRLPVSSRVKKPCGCRKCPDCPPA